MKMTDLKRGDLVAATGPHSGEGPAVVVADGWMRPRFDGAAYRQYVAGYEPSADRFDGAAYRQYVVGYEPSADRLDRRGVLLLVVLSHRLRRQHGGTSDNDSAPTLDDVLAELPQWGSHVAAALPGLPAGLPDYVELVLAPPRQVSAMWADHVAQQERDRAARQAERERQDAARDADQRARERVVSVINSAPVDEVAGSPWEIPRFPQLPSTWEQFERLAQAYAAGRKGGAA